MKGEFATTHMEAGAQKELRARIRDPRIFVGRGTYGAPRFVLYSADDRITIGRYCSIAECAIMGGGEHNYRTTSTFPFHWYHGDDPGSTSDDPAKVRYYNAIYKGPTKIGCDVWIGFGATILSGVTIGHGAVIGAAAVVASDVPPFAIMVGNPARALRKRFDDATIDLLLDIQWWNWKPEYIYEYQGLLFSPPEELFAAIRKLEKHELAGMYEENPNEIDAGYQVAEPAPQQVEVTGDVEPAAPEASTLKKLVRNITPPVVYSALYRLKH